MQTLQEAIGNHKSKEYFIIRLSKSNLADVAKLHEAVYGIAVADDYFSKKYNTAYTGAAYVGFLAYNSEGLAVAYYGVIPCFMQYENAIILAAQSADTMTHPMHRYKGMFIALARQTYALSEELGIKLIFGFPNQNFLPSAERLGFKVTETMDLFTIGINSLPLESISKKNKLFKKIYNQYKQVVLKKHITSLKGITSSALGDGYSTIQRSDAYLNYRSYSDTIVISINGTKIWMKIKNGLLIGDMEGVNDTNFNTVITQLKKLAKRLGATQLQFQCSPNISLHRLFTAICHATPSFPVILRDSGSTFSPEKIKFTFADIDIF